MKNKILITLSIFLIFSCTKLKDANLEITNKTIGRDEKNLYYEIVEVTNKGEQPAYFVILIGKAFSNGNIIQILEKSYGDIFPNQKKEFKLTYDKLGFKNPDSILYQITYSQSTNYPIK